MSLLCPNCREAIEGDSKSLFVVRCPACNIVFRPQLLDDDYESSLAEMELRGPHEKSYRAKGKQRRTCKKLTEIHSNSGLTEGIVALTTGPLGLLIALITRLSGAATRD